MNEWRRLAEAGAREAHEENFSSRRGWYCITDDRTGIARYLILYNNNPWLGSARELAELREWLMGAGIKILAEAQYGDTLEDGTLYTKCWLLDSPERELEVVEAWRAILDRLYGEPHPHLHLVC